jgi:hypothetical protein
MERSLLRNSLAGASSLYRALAEARYELEAPASESIRRRTAANTTVVPKPMLSRRGFSEQLEAPASESIRTNALI